MLPLVILHNSVSVDGRNDGFPPDIGLHYELASRWKVDAHLVGSETILASEEGMSDETGEASEPPVAEANDPRPLLVVPDSRGRVRVWRALLRTPYWRGAVALCSRSTPAPYLDHLKSERIDSIVAGDSKVDLREALEELGARYGVKSVLLDSGGTLNGVLLRAGLVDEVSLLVHPCLVGGTTPRSIFRAPDLPSSEHLIHLRLAHVEGVRDDIVWLRYQVVR